MNIIFLAIGSNYLGGFTTCMRFRVTIWHIPITVAFVIELLLLFRHLHIVVHFANIFLGFLVQFRLCYHTFFYQVLIIFQFLWSEFDNSIVIIFKVKLAFLAVYPGIFIGGSLLYKFLTHWLIRSIRIIVALRLGLAFGRLLFFHIFLMAFLAIIFRLAGAITILGNTVVLCQLWCALWCPILLGKTILS